MLIHKYGQIPVKQNSNNEMEFAVEVISLEPGEVILTKEEVKELAETLTGYISYEKEHAWTATRKIIRAYGEAKS